MSLIFAAVIAKLEDFLWIHKSICTAVKLILQVRLNGICKHKACRFVIRNVICDVVVCKKSSMCDDYQNGTKQKIYLKLYARENYTGVL
ncbi:hypothetical protein TSAR_010091 [Trichomalopsis sarcophagae]|uniref:Uncharacterized protein n=1 Tax=Trichomalopsis sarcophagae TaxID=543379 RepID=A0A232ES64_9HYME|nr:hypothetical protein TSAR_010091 [Trichomalopsis sarcophagae]